MKSRLALFFLCCLLSHYLLAQSIQLQGTVVHSATGEPVAYTSVGIAGKELGTIANARGQFQFSVPPESITAGDVVVFSGIGYEKKQLPLAELRQGKPIVRLTPQPVALQEVAVKPQKLKAKVLGKNDREYFTHSVYFTLNESVNDKLGTEIGNIIALNKGCFVNDFNFYVSYNQFKSIKFRLNLYAVKDGVPGESLLKEDILFDVKDQQKGWVQVDLRQYNLRFGNQEKVAVTMQWLESQAVDEKSKFFGFSTAISAVPRGVRRNKSEGAWEKNNVYHSMYFNADCYKAEKEAAAAE